MKEMPKSEKFDILLFLTRLLTGDLIGMAAAALLIAAVSAFAAAGNVPEELIAATACAACGTAAFTGGLYCAKRQKNAFLCGTAAGILLFLIQLLAGAVVFPHTSADGASWTMLAVCIPAGIAGGAAGRFFAGKSNRKRSKC